MNSTTQTYSYTNSFSHIRINTNVTKFKDFTEHPPTIPNPDLVIGKKHNYIKRDPRMVIFLFLVVIYSNFFQ
jgi:hypothetical protein